MQRNVFKESIYFNVYGTIIEVPYKNLVTVPKDAVIKEYFLITHMRTL